jgi:hypothetical protein
MKKLPKKYKTGNKKVDRRRLAAQRMKQRLYKKNPRDPRLWKKLPGDDKKPTKKSKYSDGKR